MFKEFWRGSRWFLTAGAIFVGGLICGSLAKEPFKEIGDLATWVGAAFAGLAFAGTISLATTETRRRHAEEKARAMICAVAICIEIKNTREQLQLAYEHLIRPHVTFTSSFNECANLLKNTSTWSADKLLPFFMLPKRCATRLAVASVWIENCKKAFASGTDVTEHDVAAQAEILGKAMTELDIALLVLDGLVAIDMGPNWS